MVGLLPRLLLLALLPIMGLAVWWDGQHFDPALLDFKQGGVALLPVQLVGLQRMAGVRHYQRDNLHEYVNGHAEFYLGAGFVALTVADYGKGEGQGPPLLTVDLFNMGTPLQAFGVLVEESAGRAAMMADGVFGYADPQGVLLMQGPYFIKIAAYGAELPLLQGVQQVVQAVGAAPGGAMTFRFPPLGQPGATRFIKENYRGLPFFNNVVEQAFQQGTETIRVFRVDARSEELPLLEEKIRVFFTESGAVISQEERQGVAFVRIEDPYEGKWFYVRDSQGLVGVFSPWREELVQPLVRFIQDDGKREKNLP